MAPEPRSQGQHHIPTHIKVIAVIAFIVSTVLVAVTAKLAWDGKLTVLSIKNVDIKKLQTFGEKLQFAAKYWSLPLFWLLTRWQVVVYKRVTTRAVDPLSENEDIVHESNQILNNSMEQILMSIISQVSLIAYLSSQQTVALIPLINVWHLIGRIAFWIGYPKYRTFGVMSTLTPTVMSVGYCLYQLLAVDLALFS